MGFEEIVLRELHVAIINSVVIVIYAKITQDSYSSFL